MPAKKIQPAERRDQVRRVGNDLVRSHGQKLFYSVDEVKAANRRQNVSAAFDCWSLAAFTSHRDFDAYHLSAGENCDYLSMKSDMLSTVSTAADTSWFDFDLSWLELPDIDWSFFYFD